MVVANNLNNEAALLSNPADDFALLYSYSDTQLDVRVDDQGMQLRKLKLWERLISWIPCRKKGRLARLNAYVNRIYQQPLGLSDQDAKKFYAKLRTWKHIKVNLTQLSEPILKGLSPQFSAARAAFNYVKAEFFAQKDTLTEAELKKAKSTYNHYLLDALYAETRLAADLGIGPELTKGGVNGAKFGLGLDGKKILVLKENGIDRRPKWRTEAIIKGQRTQPQVCNHDPRMAGAVAFMASEHFGFEIVPPTFTDDQGVSAQLFIDRAKFADKRNLGLFGLQKLEGTKVTESELDLLQTKAVFNYLVGDLDGKDDKLVLKLDENGRISKIYETDNDNTFPEESLSKKTDFVTVSFKIHQWKNHKWAKEQLNPKANSRLFAILEKLYNPVEIESFREKIDQRYPGFFTEGRWKLFLERLALIKTACDRKWSVSQLGRVYSPEYFERPHDPQDILHAQLFNRYFEEHASLDQYAQRMERLERS